MARAKRDDKVEEIRTMDFEKGERLYKNDFRPARARAAEFNQEASTAAKYVKKDAHLDPVGWKDAIKAHEMEDAKRSSYFRSFVGQYNQLAGRTVLTYHGDDLVDLAEGFATSLSPRPNLVVVPSDGSETDFTDAADISPRDLDLGEGVGGFEASEDELSKQTGRKPRKVKD